jgi:hypothetical protein
MAIEMDKINKEFKEHNMIKDFGLISWTHMDELFPWTNIPIKKVGNVCMSFSISLRTCHRAGRRTLKTPRGNPWPCIGRKI